MLKRFNQASPIIQGSLILIGCLVSSFCSKPVLAQLKPDRTLGAESSVVRENVQVKGALGELIEGGATRNINLFHSFSDFNVGDLQRVYFANPTGINNILTRVTGGNASNIFGILGVDGSANLYLLNPNGIVFGKNSHLDIAGSFTATTANSVVFNDFNFSATNPESPPLLKVSVPLGLQYLTSQPAGIINAGQLAVGNGQNLSLVAGTLVNTGQILAPEGHVIIATIPSREVNSNSLFNLLKSAGSADNFGVIVTDTGEVRLRDSSYKVEMGDIVIAGEKELPSIQGKTATLVAANNLILNSAGLYTSEDLNLLAFDTVRVRDNITNAFNAEAGGNLYIQGNQGIDILALNHPHTPFQSGGNLSLVSDGIISGDAHFASGGRFSILNLLGKPGNFVSLYDPIISSQKDVIIGDYIGTSLKIESMGSIATGNIIISGADTSLTPNTDSDISILRSSPSLILRAGVEHLENPPTPSTASSSPVQIPFPIIISSTPVYNNDFQGNVGEEWSNTSTDITPVGERKFLGQFSGTSLVDLSINNLPDHQLATVFFDLFILKSWDGNKLSDGPDIWGLSVDGGIPLLITTFINVDPPYTSLVESQSYPDNYNPLSTNNVNNLPRTGAIENNSLGYKFSPFGERSIDSVYKLNFTFPHSDSSLGLHFLSILGGFTGIEDESWGLDNVAVAVHKAVTPTGETFPTITPPPPTFTTSGQQSAGSITTGNILTLGGPVIFSGKSDITLNGSINTLGGDVTLNSGGKISAIASQINSQLDNNNGGKITLKADGDILGGMNIRGGETRVESGGTINLSQSRISTASGNNGSAITLIANGNIFTGELESRGGDITLNSGGKINTIAGELKSFSINRGGDITLAANSDISVGQITSSGDKGGGNITFNTNGNFSVDGLFTIRSDAYQSGVGGNIAITANSVFLKNGTLILTGSERGGTGGNLNVTANFIDLSGFGIIPGGFFGNGQDVLVPTGMSTSTASSENAGTLTINTQRLTIRDGASGLGTITTGSGRGGDIIINASESVELIGIEGENLPPIGLLADTADINNRFGNNSLIDGDAGNIFIDTKRLFVRNGAIVSSSTFNSGHGGNLIISASELIKLSGTSSNDFSSGFYSQAFGTGNAGKVEINTPQLTIEGGATVTARTATVSDVNYPTTSIFQQEFGAVFSPKATGNAGDLLINTKELTVINGGEISAFTLGEGNAGTISLNVTNNTNLIGDNSRLSVATSSSGKPGNIILSTGHLNVSQGAEITATATSTATNSQEGGNISIYTPEMNLDGRVAIIAETQGVIPAGTINLQSPNGGQNLKINFSQGAEISASTSAQGTGGSIVLTAPEAIALLGQGTLKVESSGLGNAGNIKFATQNLTIADGVTVSASNSAQGTGGNIDIMAGNSFLLQQSNLLTETTGIGTAGNININTSQFTAQNAQISARSQGQGNSGNINTYVMGELLAKDSQIKTSALQSSGGAINITAGDIRFWGNSDMTTNVFSGVGGGGDISLTVGSILAFDDSDILAFARDGKGGNITLNTPAFFGSSYGLSPNDIDPATLDGNNRVDINASGAVNGLITLPDVSFIQNSLTKLPDNLINTENIIANSCIVRKSKKQGTFNITGSGGLPTRPGDASVSPFPTGEVRNIPSSPISNTTRDWKRGDPIVEPTGVYQLPSGELVLHRECS
ncbi:MAG: filamentous hemagglutinin N-terminal domain-containing protein [Dolichospermum sp. DET73]|nr:filamentous hemagglutinin N-terminal domain-containing protein [Dolichospermum sp. DET73]